MLGDGPNLAASWMGWQPLESTLQIADTVVEDWRGYCLLVPVTAECIATAGLITMQLLFPLSLWFDLRAI